MSQRTGVLRSAGRSSSCCRGTRCLLQISFKPDRLTSHLERTAPHEMIQFDWWPSLLSLYFEALCVFYSLWEMFCRFLLKFLWIFCFIFAPERKVGAEKTKRFAPMIWMFEHLLNLVFTNIYLSVHSVKTAAWDTSSSSSSSSSWSWRHQNPSILQCLAGLWLLTSDPLALSAVSSLVEIGFPQTTFRGGLDRTPLMTPARPELSCRSSSWPESPAAAG